MGPAAPDTQTQFVELRKAYDDAFHQLSQQVRLLQSVASQATPDRRAIEEATLAVEQARCVYRKRRDLLAEFVLSHAVKAAAAIVRQAGAAAMDSGGEARSIRRDLDRRSEVERLAYQLWENADRPFGRAEEHWYRAEQMIRGAA